MGTILEDARETIRAINANLSATPTGGRPNALYGRVNPKTGAVEWHRRTRRMLRRSGFPFFSMSLSVAPEDVPLTRELLRAHGVSAEFNADGCPKVESAVHHRRIAQALGLFSGRDGYGHQSVSGRHENSGARRGRELAEGRARVGRLRRELEAMPEDADLGAVEEVVRRHS